MRTSLIVVLLCGCMATFANGVAAAGGQPGYKVGDRLAQPAPSAGDAYKETDWETLVPKDWDPMQSLKELKLGSLKDSDPRAMEALRQLKQAWDNAPVESSLRGQRIRIAGFVVPLEHKKDLVSEFLLVPYFGACIHVPPPPANQVIHVIPAAPLKETQSMAAVWVSGTLNIAHSDSPWGAAGYKMKADVVAPYAKTKP